MRQPHIHCLQVFPGRPFLPVSCWPPWPAPRRTTARTVSHHTTRLSSPLACWPAVRWDHRRHRPLLLVGGDRNSWRCRVAQHAASSTPETDSASVGGGGGSQSCSRRFTAPPSLPLPPLTSRRSALPLTCSRPWTPGGRVVFPPPWPERGQPPWEKPVVPHSKGIGTSARHVLRRSPPPANSAAWVPDTSPRRGVWRLFYVPHCTGAREPPSLLICRECACL